MISGKLIQNMYTRNDFQRIVWDVTKTDRKLKGSPRVCPNLSMDFVRLLFFKVFWMLINVQKKIFGKFGF